MSTMKKLFALILALVMLFAFVPSVFAVSSEEDSEIEFIVLDKATAKGTVARYFSALYDSYIAMKSVDISPILDLEHEMMQNVLNWNELLIMRRKLIKENGYCYVETERFDYEIEFIKQRDLDDERMYYVNLSDYGKNVTVLHFVIKGEDNKAYPPIFALNSQHTMILTEENGVYKIAYHYFPGSEGKFQNDLPVETMTEDEMSTLLAEEFSYVWEPVYEFPEYERLYDAESATEYALTYCEEHNPDFYFVGDWYGNCMNFASQCVWSGFREDDETVIKLEGMTKLWYCGKYGGTLPWASVSRFWQWSQKDNCKMQTSVFFCPDNAKNGDIVHIGSYACLEEEKYTHALIVADAEKMLLAQNSPACFVYYSDLANNYTRFIRPISIDT